LHSGGGVADCTLRGEVVVTEGALGAAEDAPAQVGDDAVREVGVDPDARDEPAFRCEAEPSPGFCPKTPPAKRARLTRSETTPARLSKTIIPLESI